MDFKGVSPVDLPSPRYDHCSALVTMDKKEKLLIFGGAGEDGPTNDVWLYDIGKEWDNRVRSRRLRLWLGTGGLARTC